VSSDGLVSSRYADGAARLAALKVPIVLFACHSDPGLERDVEPVYANSIGEPHNIGLIEVTDKTSDGRSKMRNGVRFLVSKLEQRLCAFPSRRRIEQQLTNSEATPEGWPKRLDQCI
jgi:hypothetical protein